MQADSKDDDGRTPLWYAKKAQAHFKDALKDDFKDDDEARRLLLKEEVNHVAVVKLLEQHLHKTDHPHPPP